MLYTITPAEMKRVENRVISAAGITGEQLMHAAATHIAQAVEHHAPKGRVVAVCGSGNNGGDGIAALRLLYENAPRPLSLWLLSGERSKDCERELASFRQAVPHAEILIFPLSALPPFPADTACIVDALFGTGLSRKVTGTAAELCGHINAAYEAGIPVIAADIPSGLCGESGRVWGITAKATETITFHRPKPGLWLRLGPNHTGTVTIADIGIPPRWDDAAGMAVLESCDLPVFLPPRKPLSHKGDYGRVLIIAGSLGMAGAAALCTTAALRTGAGLVTVACPANIVNTIQQLCPCATCLPLPHEPTAARSILQAALSKADAVALGCGLGADWHAHSIALSAIAYIINKNIPAVIDADGLNALAKETADPTHEIKFTARQILTPHPAEAARLLSCSTESITLSPRKAAKDLQKKYGASILLKGTATVLLSAAQEGLNTLGTPALAKGGSGDVLAGTLTALLANVQKGTLSLSPFEAMQVGTALHGLAAQTAAQKYGQRGVLATDVCDFLGQDFYALG